MSPRTSLRLGLGFAVAAIVGVLSTSQARANGAFPQVSQLVSNPEDPRQLALRGNFGVLVSRDGGQIWDWLCEAGMGYRDIEPPLAMLGSGTMLLAQPDGVSRADLDWCSFERAAGIAANVVDVSAERDTPGAAIAVSVDLEAITTQVWESLDDGSSFAPVGEPIANFKATTIDVAPSDSDVIYLSGVAGNGRDTTLYRSPDHGRSFTAFPLPSGLAISAWPYIAAIDPNDSDRVYLRTNGAPGELLVTRDGGRTFTRVLTLEGPIGAFALSPDGSTALASTLRSGLHRIDTAALESEKIACDGVLGLTWTREGVYAAGDLIASGYLVSFAPDASRKLQPLLMPTCIRGPVACSAATSIGSVCPAAWPSVRQNLGPDGCRTDVVLPHLDCTDAVGASGTGGAEGAGGGSGNEGGTGSDSVSSLGGESAAGQGTEPLSGAPGNPTGGAGGKASGADSNLVPRGGGCSVVLARIGASPWLILAAGALLGARRRSSRNRNGERRVASVQRSHGRKRAREDGATEA